MEEGSPTYQSNPGHFSLGEGHGPVGDISVAVEVEAPGICICIAEAFFKEFILPGFWIDCLEGGEKYLLKFSGHALSQIEEGPKIGIP